MVVILCDENYPKVNHMFYSMIKNSEKASARSLESPREHAHSGGDSDV